MCGIAGWIDLKRNIGEEDVVKEMASTLVDRGPDASGFYSHAHAQIGHRRLIVVDPKGGLQPMIKQRHGTKYVLTYNGELYNTDDIRKILIALGHSFETTSDTEVLLEAYIEWKEKCVEYFNGIFAFGIWDESNKIFFLARDRFGVKPLFYAFREDSLIFASELKAMLVHPLIKPVIDKEGLSEVMCLGPSRTPGHGVFKNVFELKPGWCLRLDPEGQKIYQYWNLESKPHEDDLETTIEKLSFLVKDAITRQLIADVPVCTFLSGGLDSSSITAYAANKFRLEGKKLHTFSIDYVDNDKYFKASAFQPNSDSEFVKLMAEKFDTEHHYINYDTPQLVEALYNALEARDLPGMADVDSSLWLFCKEIKKQSVVALSGECADEIFGGYPWFHREELMNAGTFPWLRFLDEKTEIFNADILSIIKPKEYVDRRYYETLAQVPALPGEDKANARRREIFYLNMTWFMTTLLDRKDRMSMASGLEVRVPYCDHRIVEYVWNIPWEMKTIHGHEKGILREALKGVLPEEILYRKKSPYPKTHNPSYEKMVRNRLKDIIYSDSPLVDLLNKDIVLGLMKESSDLGRPFFGQLMAKPQLYAYLIQMDHWLRKYNISIRL